MNDKCNFTEESFLLINIFDKRFYIFLKPTVYSKGFDIFLGALALVAPAFAATVAPFFAGIAGSFGKFYLN